MKGIIFNITESFLTDNYGEDKFDEIITACNLITQEPFVAPGTYPDEDLLEIVAKASVILGLTPAQFLKKLGHYTFLQLSTKYPVFVAPYKHPKDFLKTIEDIVHVEVRKLYKDTYLPTFQYSEPSDDSLIITYYSKRKLYKLMEGLIDGVAEHFKTPIEQQHSVYEKDGLEYCDFKLQFANEYE